MKSKTSKFECRLCGSPRTESVINLDGFPKSAQCFISNLDNTEEDQSITLMVCQCTDCGLIQLKNNPVSYFKDVITAASLSEASKENLVNEWRPFIEKYKIVGKDAIEVGSGRGDFLEVLERLDVNAYGIEHSIDNIKECQKKKLNVDKAYLTELPETYNKKYSLVVCNNFLEHQPDTKKYLSCLRNLVSNNGVIYISVPNVDYLLEKNCLYEFVADHLVYFTEKTLRKAMEINGFNVLESYKKNNGNDLVVIAKPEPRINIDGAIETVSDIVKSIQKEVERHTNVAIWSAGHRALALMAIAKLEKIKYVIDSATFKQGKFTPILHKKIISPEDFISIKCDLLIIMLPGNYAEQVIRFLEEKKISCKIVVFEDKALLS
jgi:2-polyprenyl-3-methyl-5-hydroxy-6-metoxy-1,4-benzoquinol methylase